MDGIPQDEEDPTVEQTLIGNIPETSPREEVSAFDSLPVLCGTAYTDANLLAGQYDLYSGQEMYVNFTISSLAIGPSCGIILTDRNGITRRFTAGENGLYVSYVGNDWNDRAARIYCSCATYRPVASRVYRDAYYASNYFPVWNNTYGSMPYMWHDQVSSIRTNSSSSTVLTENTPPSGSAHTTQGTSAFYVFTFNDKASYFRASSTY